MHETRYDINDLRILHRFVSPDRLWDIPYGSCTYVERTKRKELRITSTVVWCMSPQREFIDFIENTYVTVKLLEICERHGMDMQDLSDTDLMIISMEYQP